MRVAVIVVTLLVATTPSEASESCMTKAEARQHFPTMHIYWHGLDHCWGAMPAGSHPIHQVRRGAPSREVQREVDQPKIDQPTWRDSMSAMLPDDDPMGASREARPDANDDADAPTRWGDRWVEIEQSPLAARSVEGSTSTGTGAVGSCPLYVPPERAASDAVFPLRIATSVEPKVLKTVDAFTLM